jgi:hypothetical protein
VFDRCNWRRCHVVHLDLAAAAQAQSALHQPLISAAVPGNQPHSAQLLLLFALQMLMLQEACYLMPVAAAAAL